MNKYPILKKTKLILCYYAVLLTTSGCNSILQQDPRNELSEEIAIADARGAEAAVAGLYNQLQDGNYYGRNFLIMSDVSSDQAQSIGTWDFYREMDTYQNSTGNTEIGYFYSRAYKTVYVANTIISVLPTLEDLTDTQRSSMLGEAYFVRALAYFDLIRIFGGYPEVVGSLGVAIVNEEERGVLSEPARTSLADSYAYVETDLLRALDLLPESSDRSRASKGAARALLSRLYLYTRDFASCISYADAVIATQNTYNLNPSYTDIFATKLSTESIFELNFNNADQSGVRNWYFPTSQGGRGDLACHPSFVEKAQADPDDVRGTLYAYENSARVYYPTKYNKSGNIDNIHVIRIAEMYLNRAEAKVISGVDLEGALADLNMIRERAGAQPHNTTDPNTLLAYIWEEQQLEFAFEGHSFFDLIRTGQAQETVSNIPRLNAPNSISFTNLERALFPIPLFEINANPNMVQNSAYQ
ncbi:RagB/SusD family nutrient uptake outer membrane protein [Olivibacter sp. SDN3]|uniref:RagB/SusD family nutrient uptake outer membrane protein n=1 Tax=Olivibacter sp. SDN3 TaxID=2764720 RepID=UPI001651608B|nr:RagB/SusD family nutrient uptake outer membrane protein [Olivibacter sp. SDN3]QNL52014.1 RagB/SusD family nutrient uptake outer membrane protein [Olivibacter sp. SDN3]